jgi:hypothetical protein
MNEPDDTRGGRDTHDPQDGAESGSAVGRDSEAVTGSAVPQGGAETGQERPRASKAATGTTQPGKRAPTPPAEPDPDGGTR